MSTDVVVRPLTGPDLDEADRICRVAFGTFVGTPEPERYFGDADITRTHWKADPAGALAAEVDGRLVGQRPARHPAQPLLAGDRVVFTGDMDMSRAEIEALATAAGLRVTTAVSAKTALVVAADPYSQSGKASQARKLGVRMVTEQVFLDLLDHMQQSGDITPPAQQGEVLA